MPKVSVVLTSYNHEKYIKEAIDSVLNQTYTDFELIIWDDASTDNSWNIINCYNDKRIIKFRNEYNRRAVYAINNSISEVAKGEYIAIHHSDDVWEPAKLKKQVEFLDNNQGCGAVFTAASIIDDNGDYFLNRKHLYYSIFEQSNKNRFEWLRHFFYKGNGLCHPSVLIRKNCFNECGFYRAGLAQLLDLDMWIRLCLKYEIYVIQDKLVRFRIRANEANASGNRPEVIIRDSNEWLIIAKNFLQISSYDDIIKTFPSAVKYYSSKGFNHKFVMSMIFLFDGKNKKQYLTLALETLFDLIFDMEQANKIKEIYDFDYISLIKLTDKFNIF